MPVRMAEQQYEQLRQAAYERHISLAELVRQALDKYLAEREERKMVEAGHEYYCMQVFPEGSDDPGQARDFLHPTPVEEWDEEHDSTPGDFDLWVEVRGDLSGVNPGESEGDIIYCTVEVNRLDKVGNNPCPECGALLIRKLCPFCE